MQHLLSPLENFDTENTYLSGWRAPSNIAIVKYWGKLQGQIPANPSLSFTLDQSQTKTFVELKRRSGFDQQFSFKVFFEGFQETSFEPKIRSLFENIVVFFPFLEKFDIKITSENNFPHSSGIASSASSMAALALCILSLEELLGAKRNKEDFLRMASFVARIGSGSACRSIEGPLTIWGKTPAVACSSDFYAIKYPYKLDYIFNTFKDTVLLVDEGQKEISSSKGHSLMNKHPFAKARFNEAHKNIECLKDILKSGDLQAFGTLAESEALMLHSLMMSASPYYILMKPNTLSIIEKVWQARRDGICVYFTLDAGANVHLLYPRSEELKVNSLVDAVLLKYCSRNKFISDKLGRGAEHTHSKIILPNGKLLNIKHPEFNDLTE